MVKLGDLNISKVAKKGLTSTQTGTPYYASPEVWKDLSYNYKSDIWSLGCVLYEIITLNLPFSNNLGDLYKNIMKGEIKKIPDRYSNDLDNIVHLLIQVNQDKRPSCKDLLNNPIIKNKIEYFKNIDIDNLNDKYDDMDNSFLLKTIEIPKNFTKTPFRLPKSNYSKNENEKYLDNLSYNNINNKSAFKEKNNRNIYNNYNLPFIKNTRKIMYNKGKINYDNSQFGIQKIINNIKYNNNFDEEINMNKDHKINHNNLLNNYNIQLIKIRNNRNNKSTTLSGKANYNADKKKPDIRIAIFHNVFVFEKFLRIEFVPNSQFRIDPLSG
jgi:NIMA (never in mitosis gene a)-related kinase